MNFIEKIATFAGSFLTLIAVALLWYVDWTLGLLFTIFVVIVFVWCMRLRTAGNYYLKQVAELIGCSFEGSGPSYGRVTGSYRGRQIEIGVNKGYDAARALSGLSASLIAFDSMIGTLAGIKNFTVVKLGHKAHITEPFRMEERVYVSKNEVLYIPPCDEVSGLPMVGTSSLVSEIDRIIDMIEELEHSRDR